MTPTYIVASPRQEFDGFDADGLIRRGRVRPAGELHAIELFADLTVCGLERATLHVFPKLPFDSRRSWAVCSYCRATAQL